MLTVLLFILPPQALRAQALRAQALRAQALRAQALRAQALRPYPDTPLNKAIGYQVSARVREDLLLVAERS